MINSEGSYTSVSGLTLSSEANKIAYWGYQQRIYTLSIWDYVKGGTNYLTFANPVIDVKFSKNPDILFVAKNNEIISWNYKTNYKIPVYSARTCSISEFAIESSGLFMAVGDECGEITLYGLYNGHEIAILSTLQGRVTALSFSSDDTLLASMNSNGTGFLWFQYR